MYIIDCFVFVLSNKDLFEEFQQKHSYVTRFKANLVPEKCNFTFIQKNVPYCALKIFNYFPKCVRDLPEDRVKIVVKNYLISKAFYSLKDFFSDTDIKHIAVRCAY